MREEIIRKVELPRDRDALLALDISFTSPAIFHVADIEGLQLSSVPVAIPVEKRFPLRLDADEWRDGWVIDEEGAIRGFVACTHNAWNNRMVIWHFYVDLPHRRRGFGRLLMESALSHYRSFGVKTAWLETTNLNVPGVLAYEALGFKLCGFDQTLYKGTPSEGEFALFMAQEI